MPRARVCIAVALVAASCVPMDRATAATPPNVLVIVTDDQRADTLWIMPSTRRWLSDEGARFPRAYATTPVCCPSRASILTGLLAHNHGLRRNRNDLASMLAVEERMLQHALQAQGYRTGLFGKYLNGWPTDTDPSGWDRWAVSERATYTGDAWNVDGAVVTVDRNSTPYLGDLVRSFVQETEALDDERPWFAYAAFSAPHRPATAPAGYRHAPVPGLVRDPAMNERDVRDKPWWVRRKRHLVPTRVIEEIRVPMLRTLIALDHEIDRTMERLESLGELDDTLVIFLSDNGFMWGEHRLMKKSVPYLPSIEVPFLVRWPEHVPATADPRIVGTVDVAPTVLTAAGAPFPHEMDGVDVLGEEVRTRLPLEFWRADQSSWRGVVARRWTFVEYLRADGQVRAREYYRLWRDPDQLTNVYRDGIAGNGPDTEGLSSLAEALAGCRGAGCIV